MAQHIRIRREQFSEDASKAYDLFLRTLQDLAEDHDLDPEVVSEELSYLFTPRELWDVRTAGAKK